MSMLLPKQAMPFLLLLLFLGLRPPAALADEQFVFSGFTGANLSLDGMATVTPSGLLQLTGDGLTLATGLASYPTPLQFHGSSTGATMQSFSTAFVISIISESGGGLSSPGMAFVIAKNKDLSSASRTRTHYLGLASPRNNGNATNHRFAIEFDTTLNREFNDTSDNDVGIDAVNTGYYDDATGSFTNMNLSSGKPMQVWVEFDGRTMQINVTMAPVEMTRPKNPLLSTTVNLSTVIDDTAYVGFSSAWGIAVFTRHYVLGWSFKMNGAAPALDISSLPSLPATIPKLRLRSTTLEVVLPVASTILVVTVAAVVALSVFMRRRRMHAEKTEQWEVELGPHKFSYKDLLHATDGFSDERLLGAGGFGSVYRGVLPASNAQVAVKKSSDRSRQGMKEFVSEVVSIGRLGHRNLVQLIGYCRRNSELLLVYDYMPHGSLDKHLHDHTKPALSWGQRFRIIRDVASGLLYLHEDWKQVVLHRDIKASNVVLDAEMNGRLADFGLARLYDHGDDHLHTTHVAGTIGYLAPELGRTCRASKASDVYAFGVLVLEVACGRKPVVVRSGHHPVLLVHWVLDRWRAGWVTDAVDRRLHGSFAAHEASLLLTLGLLCTQQLPEARPGMRHIQRYLDGDMLLPELSTTSWQSFDMAQHPNPMAVAPAYTGVSRMSDLSGGR